MTTRFGPVGVEVPVAGRVGRTNGQIAVLAEFAQVIVEERFDQASIGDAGYREFNRNIGMIRHAVQRTGRSAAPYCADR